MNRASETGGAVGGGPTVRVAGQAGPGSVRSTGVAGIWGWLWQRITAVLLCVVLGFHLYVLHFSGQHVLTTAGVSIRFSVLSYAIVDYTLLAVALYHGLYGLRSVLLDYITGERATRVLTAIVWIVGLVAFVYGAYVLVPFIQG